jgi:hypothetical protein
MFVATPIIDNGDIIAVLTFWIDIKKYFSRILEIGAIGETRETYAYNQSDKIVSKTRFNEGLQERLDLSIPNSNENDKDLFVGDTIVNINYNVTETNKFEKKDIYKVSQWDKELGIGLITKINKREVLESYFLVRNTFIGSFIGIGVFVFLLVNIIVSQRHQKQKKLENTKKELEILVLTRTKELNKTIATKTNFSPF